MRTNFEAMLNNKQHFYGYMFVTHATFPIQEMWVMGGGQVGGLKTVIRRKAVYVCMYVCMYIYIYI